MSDDGLLGRAELERAFAALGDRLVRRGVVADLFIVGGAAMALAYDVQRVTETSTPLSYLTVSSSKRPATWRRRWDCRRGG